MNRFPSFFGNKQRLWLMAFLLLHTAASFYYISQQNITYDEPQYIEYAKRWLHGKPERIELLDDSKSPVVAICWLPRIVRQLINPHYKLTDYGRKDQKEGRYMMILFSLLAAVYVYWWCRDWYGAKGWQLPLLLLLFDPLYLAYSTLITTDLACGAFFVALLYHFRKHLLTGSFRQFCLAAFYVGMAILTKQTLVFTIILLPLLSCFYHFHNRSQQPFLLLKAAKQFAVFVLLVLLVINVGYYFHHTLIPLGNYHFESKVFTQLQSTFLWLHWLPVPLPEGYLQSLDMLKAHAEYGPGKALSTYNGVYLFGNLKMDGGYWYYYFVTFFYKMPVGILLLIVAAIVLFFKKIHTKSFITRYMFLIVPIAFYWLILSCFNNFQIGIRHLLLLFPLLYIGLGKCLHEISRMKMPFKVATVAALVYSFVSVLLYYPFIIPYTNELAGDKKQVCRIIMDSSIDYGQSDSAAVVFVKTHYDYQPPTSVPTVGKYALPMAHVINTFLWHRNPYDWYQKMKPAGLYRNVVLLYDVQQSDLEKAGFK